MTVEKFRSLVFDDPDSSANFIHAALVGTAEGLEGEVMRSACLLHRLSLKAKTDSRLLSFYKSYLDFVVKRALSNGKIEMLANQVRNFIEIDRLSWVESFAERNKELLSISFFSELKQLSSALSRCVIETDRLLEVWCGRQVVADFQNFNEDAYLIENSDVKRSVSEGGFKDAFDHFSRCGYREGRQLRIFAADV